ncbi:hypothetical protein SLS57_004842 [Botryosphaeria dothidea]
MAESISEGTLSLISKKIGDRVEQDEEIASIETDKIDVAVNAPEAGVVAEVLVGEGDVVKVGQEVFRIELDADSGKGAQEAKETQERGKAKGGPAEHEKKVEPLMAALTTTNASAAQPRPSPAPSPPPTAPPASTLRVPDTPAFVETPPPPNKPSRKETRVKMTRLRSTIATRLKASQNRTASLTTFNEVDMSALLALRARHRASVLETHGVRLGFMALFARAATLALQAVPAVNASISDDGETAVWRDYVDISFAVSAPKGLVTPVLRGCEGLGVVEMEKGIAALAAKARAGALAMGDLQGGSFTISNGGVFGSLWGTPIINLPQTAVLGLHGVKERPVVVDGEVVVRPMMYLALTYDHRMVDGKEAVTFLVKIKEYIEDPTSMLLV